MIPSCVNKGSFASSFVTCIPFISFSYRQCLQYNVEQSGKREDIFVILLIFGESFSFSTLTLLLALAFLQIPFKRLRKFTTTINLLRISIRNEYWILLKTIKIHKKRTEKKENFFSCRKTMSKYVNFHNLSIYSIYLNFSKDTSRFI